MMTIKILKKAKYLGFIYEIFDLKIKNKNSIMTVEEALNLL